MRLLFLAITALATASLYNPVLASQTFGAGTFKGKSGHVTTGQVTIEKTDDGFVVVLQDDFFFDGAPDPKVVIGAKSSGERTEIAHLSKNTGKQNYPIPSGIDITEIDEVWIWCKRYAVPLGYSLLKK